MTCWGLIGMGVTSTRAFHSGHVTGARSANDSGTASGTSCVRKDMTLLTILTIMSASAFQALRQRHFLLSLTSWVTLA